MENQQITDLFKFQMKNRFNVRGFLPIITIVTIFLICLLPIASSLPSNDDYQLTHSDVHLKKDLDKADNLEVNQTQLNNTLENHELHKHHQKPGKHRRKKFHSKKQKLTKSEHKKDNGNLNNSKWKYNATDPNAKKFDYYPIEPVDVQYDPHEDENIRFVLITGDDDKTRKDKKHKNRRRHKRSLSDSESSTSINGNEMKSRQKRNQNGISSVKDSYDQYAKPEPWDHNYYRYGVPVQGTVHKKYPIPGIYYNAITPHRFRPLPPSPDSLTNRLDTDIGPVWDRRPINNIISSGIKTTRSPLRTPTTQRRPLVGVNPTPIPENSGPSSCIWAIVNCCSKDDLKIRYGCFEQLGCVGAFWDFNPCGDSWQSKAVEEAEKYFDEYDDI